MPQHEDEKTPLTAAEMARKRWAGVSPEERTAITKKASRARWGEPRKNSKRGKKSIGDLVDAITNSTMEAKPITASDIRRAAELLKKAEEAY